MPSLNNNNVMDKSSKIKKNNNIFVSKKIFNTISKPYYVLYKKNKLICKYYVVLKMLILLSIVKELTYMNLYQIIKL